MSQNVSFQDVVTKVASLKEIFERHQASLIAAADSCEDMMKSDNSTVRERAPELSATVQRMIETCDNSLVAITYMSAVFSNDHPVVPFMSSSKISQAMKILNAVEFGAGGLDVLLKCLEEDMQALGVH